MIERTSKPKTDKADSHTLLDLKDVLSGIERRIEIIQINANVVDKGN